LAATCYPIGHWWQGQLYNTAHPNSQISRKAPATSHTTRPGEANQNGHPDRVKTKRGGSRVEEKMGAGISLILTADKRG